MQPCMMVKGQIIWAKKDSIWFGTIYQTKIKRAYSYNEYEFGGQKWLSIKAVDVSLKALVIQKLYLVRMSHPMFKKGIFLFYSDYNLSLSVVWKGNHLQNIVLF